MASDKAYLWVYRLSWFFPVTYLIHLGEELWAGEGFPQWLTRLTGSKLSVTEFLLLNTFAFSLMVAGSKMAATRGRYWWIIITFATVTGTNGLLHLLVSVVTKTYSPGVISGILLWFPFSVWTISALGKELRAREIWAGVGVGIGIHVIVWTVSI